MKRLGKWSLESLLLIWYLQSKVHSHISLQLVIAGLNRWVLDTETRTSKEAELAKYIVGTKGNHFYWCLKVKKASIF